MSLYFDVMVNLISVIFILTLFFPYEFNTGISATRNNVHMYTAASCPFHTFSIPTDLVHLKQHCIILINIGSSLLVISVSALVLTRESMNK